jgi:hypothetical protein
MTFATTYSIPIGVCVTCGGEIIGRRRNAIYCDLCIAGGKSHVRANASLKNISAAITHAQMDFLEYLASTAYSSRSEALRSIIDYRIESFRRPIDPIVVTPLTLQRGNQQ